MIFHFFCLNAQIKSKKNVTVSDYEKWGTLVYPSLSEKGNWTSYCMKYNDVADTLSVKSIEKKHIYKFPNAEHGTFFNEHFFIFFDNAETLHKLDLTKGTVQKTYNTKKYSVSLKDNYLITLERSDKENSVCIRTLDGELIYMEKGAIDFKINNSCDALICITETPHSKSLVLIKLGTKITKTHIAEGSDEIYTNLTWSDSGNSFAFISNSKNQNKTKLFQYLIKLDRLYVFDSANAKDFPIGYKISARPNSLAISADDSRLIFSISKSLANHISDTVQIWTTNDAVVYPEKKNSGDIDYDTATASWEPLNEKFLKITDYIAPHCILNSTKDYALVYSFIDNAQYNPTQRNVNYFVTDLHTGRRHLLVEDQQTGLHNSSMSPKGTYFAYLNNNAWWIYDFRKKLKIKLAKADNNSLEKKSPFEEEPSYRFGGWSEDEKYILVHDLYDIWKIDLDGKEIFPLTKGFKNNIQFRMVPQGKKPSLSFSGNTSQVVAGQKILVSAKSENETGFFLLDLHGKLNKISYDKSLHSKISKAVQAEKYVFIDEKYNCPPRLIYFDRTKKKKELVFQSNNHHFNYFWGRQEFIKYKNSLNEELNGTLYYPFNYESKRKYPMVVFIYEELSYRNHYYTNPSRYNPAGFNVSSLTAAGYFVLMPDIKYKIGNPGFSAADCVLSATKKVISLDIVNKDKVALMGHSFGGYETNFIVTQSDIFKTAISGVSIFDLERMYLSISESAQKPELWRFESQQWRMGSSLFEGRKNYENNSPSTYVEKINTPMLLWSGEIDRQINPDQSIALYLALRRLGKKSSLLMYPNESHSLFLKKSQIDLYERLFDWLGFYLKNEQPADWIKKGL